MEKLEKICTLHSSQGCSDLTSYNRNCGLNEHATCSKCIVIPPPPKVVVEIEEKPYQPVAPVILDDSDGGTF